jgi:NAD+ synthase (glutamine-hydrolysing)
MKLAIAQINCYVGDLEGNAAKILKYVEQAKHAGASLILTPELALSGYPPEDLLLRPGFYRACRDTLEALARKVSAITLVVGYPAETAEGRFNAAAVIQDRKIIATYYKHHLPTYRVFDEDRYFNEGSEPCVFELEGVRFGVNICADIWEEGAANRAHAGGAEVLLVLNASPYHLEKQISRYEAIRGRIGETGMSIVYANLVGGQDELVFDGASFVMNPAGKLMRELPAFEETLGLTEFSGKQPLPGTIAPPLQLEAALYSALCLGVHDYVGKNGFPGVLLGLSGGIDSALTLCIAVDALGRARVRAVMMPSQFTAGMSLEDARALAETLGVPYSEFAIKPIFDVFLKTLSDEFRGLAWDTTEENIQSRIRGTLLMALSNKYGSIVLTTGNKSEMGVGYATLYGDMAGGFAVLKDLSKTMVYRLAHYRNSLSPVIPERIITRAPSAELKENQTDQDSLPAYDVLDAIMAAYVERDLSAEQIVELGFERADVERVIRLIKVSEYKRRQSPVGIRVTPRGFGKDWRFPITYKTRLTY